MHFLMLISVIKLRILMFQQILAETLTLLSYPGKRKSCGNMDIGLCDTFTTKFPRYAVESADVVVDILGLIGNICLMNITYFIEGVVIE